MWGLNSTLQTESSVLNQLLYCALAPITGG